MPSQIARIFGQYEEALGLSKARFEEVLRERYENACAFYDEFFHDLIVDFSGRFQDGAEIRRIVKSIEQTFGRKDLTFAAVDGTCYKKDLQNYMVFFGASYAVRGKVRLLSEPPSVSYEKYSAEWDTSMVAYVPIPFAELTDVTEESFTVSDEDKIDLSYVHTQLMLLAEVFLAYDIVRSPGFAPNVLLWDQSMSSILARTDVRWEQIGVVGRKFGKTTLTPQDVIVAYSHPWGPDLGVPSSKKIEIYNWILCRLGQPGQKGKLSDFASESGLMESELLSRIRRYLLNDLGGNPALVKFDDKEGTLTMNPDYLESWEYVRGIFDRLASRLFKDKDPAALVYTVREGGTDRQRWMSPADLNFLIAVGVRALIEECWKKKVLLVGITKDSASKYLSKNFLGVMRHINVYEFATGLLPWTDRTFLEALPFHDDNLSAPWSTIEFDSCFMTLHLGEDEKGTIRVMGVRGDILTTERLFAKSLAQFFLSRKGSRFSQGHVIFIDRLLHPEWDRGVSHVRACPTTADPESPLGIVEPILFRNSSTPNTMQEETMFLLNVLTRNLYPEVIGYPDPLHKADWGAKSLGKRIRGMIESSEIFLRVNPLSRTFRDLRDERRRT